MDGRNPAPSKKPSDDDSALNTNKHGFQPWFQSGASTVSQANMNVQGPSSSRTAICQRGLVDINVCEHVGRGC